MSCVLIGAKTYDREVGRCEAGGADVAAALIREGWCARCPRYDRTGRYRAAQRAAGPWPARLPGYCR